MSKSNIQYRVYSKSAFFYIEIARLVKYIMFIYVQINLKIIQIK